MIADPATLKKLLYNIQGTIILWKYLMYNIQRLADNKEFSCLYVLL